MNGSGENRHAGHDRSGAGTVFKETKPEYSLYLSLAVGICIFTFMAQKLSYLLDSVLKIQEYVPVDTKYLTILLKMIGAAYIGQFSASICKTDRAIGNQIEIFVKLYIMVLSMPVLLALMEAIYGFLV